MQSNNFQKCLLCESDKIHYEFTKDGYKIFECETCGFMFLNPQPSDEELVKIYSADYFVKDIQSEEYKIHTDMKIATARNYINFLVNYYGKKSGKLLEIGCGGGEFLSVAQETGFDVQGVEISADATARANKLLGKNCVQNGILENVELPQNHYDICVLFDAIEHVRNPIITLNKIHKILKDDGVIFIVTPSLDSWSAKLLKNKWMEFKPEHLTYFDSQTIQNVLAKTSYHQTLVTKNYKYLSFEYIKKHFDRFKVPFFTKLLAFFSIFIPGFLKRKKIKIVASGMNVLARKKPVRTKPVLSIIIPVYNEKKTFNELINRVISKELPAVEKEIVIIESNSTDGTREEVLKYQNQPGFKVILQEKPKGKGFAVRTGLEQATGDFIIIQDGDLEYDINDYDQLLEPLINYKAAFILGSRHSKGWKMRQFDKSPLVAFIMNLGQIFFTGLLNVFCGSKLKDPFTMYKVFRKDCIYNLLFKANRFDFDWEIVIKMLRKGYIPKEIPVNYNSRSFSEGKKVSFIKDPILWIIALFKSRFGQMYLKRFDKNPGKN